MSITSSLMNSYMYWGCNLCKYVYMTCTVVSLCCAANSSSSQDVACTPHPVDLHGVFCHPSIAP